MLNPTTARARFPNRTVLEQKANPLNDDELIRDVVTPRRSLIVIFRPRSFGVSVPRAEESVDPEAVDVVGQLRQGTSLICI